MERSYARLGLQRVLRVMTWDHMNKSSKLALILTQYYRDPHPIAFETSPSAFLTARWMVNLFPGVPQPCGNCAGLYNTSRYHVARCTDAQSTLRQFVTSTHLALVQNRADNAIDAAILLLAPLSGTRVTIQVSPTSSRTVPARINDTTKPVLEKIGLALQNVKSSCRTSSKDALARTVPLPPCCPAQERPILDRPP